jgi:membrane protein DedA with SNARE-associated domain
MFQELIGFLVKAIGGLGYPGILLLMALESSFFPFPSEVVVPPAGYLAAQGDMSLWLVIVAGIAGSLLGAVFNYWLAMRFGRPFFERYGRYLLVSQSALEKADIFFEKHWHISTFVGRLLPGIRQYISLPAGLTRMNFTLFCVFTALGAGIWVTVLALLGFWFGKNQAMLMPYLHKASLAMVIFSLVLVAGYVAWRRRD